ncbi:MAG TPA: hypothetical protein VGP48_11700 [Stellaceae bacterium]|jgi:hypothetical protein|nr:hypothetical protein [Stellaceae bacterium]
MGSKVATKVLGAASVLTGVLCAGVAAANQLVVVEARGGDLKPGQVVDDTKPLVLAAGQRVSLIAENGSMLTLEGPYNALPTSAAATAPGLAATLQTLVVQNQSRTNEVGVVRGANAGVAPPDPWLLDVSRPGSLCIRAGLRPVLWRATAVKTENVTITPTDRSWSMSATWAQGDDRLELPPPFPLVARSTYVVDIDRARTAVTINVLPETVSADPMRAAWMIEKGCRDQAVALLKTIH